MILRDAEVRQPSLRRLYLAPSYNRGETRHAYPLGGAERNRRRRSHQPALPLPCGRAATRHRAGTGYSPGAFDLAVFGAYVSPNPGVDMDKLEAALIEQLNKVVSEGVTPQEVETAKIRMAREAIFARDSLQAPAMSFGTALATGRTIEDVRNGRSGSAAVTVEQVNAAARAVLGQTKSVTGLLLPAPVREAAAGPAHPNQPRPTSPAGGAQPGTSGMIR